MAIVTDQDPMGRNDIDLAGEKREEKCFFCGRYLGSDDVIVWMGEGPLWLHPPCALDLAIRLVCDVREYERAIGGDVVLQGTRPFERGR